MNLEKFTHKTQEALRLALNSAQEFGHSTLEPIHFLVALLKQDDNFDLEILNNIGVDGFLSARRRKNC